MDLRRNGVLAFELLEPEEAKVRCWARKRETGGRYQLDQDIDLGSVLRFGFAAVDSVLAGAKAFGLKDMPREKQLAPWIGSWTDAENIPVLANHRSSHGDSFPARAP